MTERMENAPPTSASSVPNVSSLVPMDIPETFPHQDGDAATSITSSVESSSSATGPSSIVGELVRPPPVRTVGIVPLGSSSVRMTNPVLKKGHTRSASHGGVMRSGVGVDGQGAGGESRLPSAMARGHTRALSHGQILDGGALGSQNLRGHSRTGSKTDFILPPGHEERQQQRAVSRTDSFFHGHSRQASRSESIYTLRQTPNTSGISSWKERLCFWRRRPKTDDIACRKIVPNHLIPPNGPSDQHPNSTYAKNSIRTTKYTILSFLPKNLLEQFHRFANLYFLFIVVLNWIPAINAFGKEIAMIPVLFVLSVTAIKDIFEDRRRYISDRRINNSTCRVFRSEPKRYVKVKWKEIRVGDFVHLSCNEIVPADILMLRSSDENGVCFIETSNLDGESNLKQREVVRGFEDKRDVFQASEFRSHLEVGEPTTKIYRFHGCIVHPSGERVPIGKENLLLRDCILKNADFVEGIVVYAGHETKTMLNNGGPRYKRSAVERQMNMEVIYCVGILFVTCLIGALGSYWWLSSYNVPVPFIPTFDSTTIDRLYDAFINFWTFVIILQVMIPLSLYVTIEVTKLMQVYHIHNDVDLYDPDCDKRVECRALNIPEELGQIQYIFSDKTGTLTENKMLFRRCTIGGIDYNHALSEGEQPKMHAGSSTPMLVLNPQLQAEMSNLDIHVLMDGQNARMEVKPQFQRIQDYFLLLAVCNTVVSSRYPHRDEMNASGLIVTNGANTTFAEENDGTIPRRRPDGSLSAPSIDKYARLVESRSVTPSPPPAAHAQQVTRPTRLNESFPVHPLSPICSSNETTPTESPATRPRLLQLPLKFARNFHSSNSTPTNGNSRLTASRSPTPSPGDLKPIYEAESPDELALVNAAYSYDCRLLKRTTHSVCVALPGEGIVDFEVLHTLPFDSVRKRMSVLLRHPITKEKVLYLKGADSAVIPRLRYSDNPEIRKIVMKTQQNLNSYAKQGLRILVMAKRVLTDAEYEEWLKKHKDAERSLEDRESKINDSYARLESNLELVGATGIEDTLQEGVPDTIAALRQAGIVVWVLTGDKQETAVNIAYSCKLFTTNMEIIKLNARSCNAAKETINFHLEEAARDSPIVPNSTSSIFSVPVTALPNKQRALVVDGKTLTYILDRRSNLQMPFLNLTQYCSSVLCCRTTPLQKAFIVRIVKEQLKMRTLAIGDGANDVSMIQTADVGIGLSGKEGMQAVMASDFAITRFKHLKRLLLVHGHWCYDRLARMVQYFFYKNAAFVLVCFWFQLYCGFTGAVMIDQMYLQLFNLVFTSFPPMFIGIYDKDAPEDLLLSRPALYRQGRLGEVYKPQYFWLNMGDALYQSVIIFFVSLGAYYDSNVDIWEFGTTITVACLFVMLCHLAIETKTWNIIHVVLMIGSVLIFYIIAFLYNSFDFGVFGLAQSFWVIHRTVQSPVHWFVVLVTVVLALLPRFVARSLETCLLPSLVTRTVISHQQQTKKEEFFVSWSRSTSSSSVFRPSYCRTNHIGRDGVENGTSSPGGDGDRTAVG